MEVVEEAVPSLLIEVCVDSVDSAVKFVSLLSSMELLRIELQILLVPCMVVPTDWKSVPTLGLVEEPHLALGSSGPSKKRSRTLCR